MSPILGIMASSITGSTLNSYKSIATITVGAGGTTAASFSSIPQTFKHLQIRALVKSSVTGNVESLYVQENSDATATNYYAHDVYGNGTSAAASAFASTSIAAYGVGPANTSTTNMFGAAVIDILDYANTNKTKVFRSLAGHDANGSGIVSLNSMLWNSTAAINSIVITGNAGFLQFSSFALYGVN